MGLKESVVQRLGLPNDLDDEVTYEDGRPEDANWILEEVWYSVRDVNE